MKTSVCIFTITFAFLFTSTPGFSKAAKISNSDICMEKARTDYKVPEGESLSGDAREAYIACRLQNPDKEELPEMKGKDRCLEKMKRVYDVLTVHELTNRQVEIYNKCRLKERRQARQLRTNPRRQNLDYRSPRTSRSEQNRMLMYHECQSRADYLDAWSTYFAISAGGSAVASIAGVIGMVSINNSDVFPSDTGKAYLPLIITGAAGTLLTGIISGHFSSKAEDVRKNDCRPILGR